MPAFENNGRHVVGKMYAQYFWQRDPIVPYPIALWHGGGLTAACRENTPDDRPGWLDYFCVGNGMWHCATFLNVAVPPCRHFVKYSLQFGWNFVTISFAYLTDPFGAIHD
jgi:hypothetical protein